MSAKQTPAGPWDEAAARAYGVVALAALGVLVVALVDKGFGLWALLPTLVGLLPLLLRWPGGPPALVFCLAVLLIRGAREGVGISWSGRASVTDVVLAAAVLGYSVGSYRLRSLTVGIFPSEPRRSRGKRVPRQRRAGRLVSPKEVAALVLSLPAWTLGALVLWGVLPLGRGNPGLDPRLWRVIWLAWLWGWAGFLAWGAIGYVAARWMTAEEAGLFLQDELWKETRREQRRLGRWLAWAEIRRRRKNGRGQG